MRKHNYLVGYEGEGQCIYGKRDATNRNTFIDLLTLFQAKKLAKRIYCSSGQKKIKARVYKLVEIKD